MNCTPAERKFLDANAPDVGWMVCAEMQSQAFQRIMRRLGIVGATYSEIAEQVIKRLDGCEAVIDKLRTRK
ncbi:MAG TPA: hypothetical protein VFT88_05180 [Acidobacteriaceae bacterium]|nr:hypothetical protein [Acidobacteriaceae bacterium]